LISKKSERKNKRKNKQILPTMNVELPMRLLDWIDKDKDKINCAFNKSIALGFSDKQLQCILSLSIQSNKHIDNSRFVSLTFIVIKSYVFII